MSTVKEQAVHLLYTDDYDNEEEERIRKEIVEGTDEEFEMIRDQLNDLLSIGRDALAKQEKEKYVENYMRIRTADDWEDFKLGLQTFDELREKESNGYIILRDVGHWTGRQRGIPTHQDTLLDCIDQITDFSGSFELTIKDIDGQFRVEQAHHDSTNYFHIVALTDNTYDAETEYDDEIETEPAYVDDEYLYRLGHPNTPGSELKTFLREKCREVGFWKRHCMSESVTDGERIVSTVL